MNRLYIHNIYILIIMLLCLSCSKDGFSDIFNSVNNESSEDLSFLRIKSRRETTKSFYDNSLSTYEYNAAYDGKKVITEETYLNGKLYSCSSGRYDGLSCVSERVIFDINTGNKVSLSKSNVEYLDNTYLRIRSRRETTENFYDNSLSTYEYNAAYDGKKVITEETYLNGKLYSCSSYKYNGQSCTIKTTIYDINIGGITSISESNVDYLD